MKNAKFVIYFLVFSLLAFNCGKDEEDPVVDFFFTADFDGQAFTTDAITGSSVFGLNSIVVTKDGEEIDFIINGLDLGTYEVGGMDKTVTGAIGVSHSSSSGSLTVTSYDADSKIMEGTVGMVLTSGLPGVADINISNGEFRMKFIF